MTDSLWLIYKSTEKVGSPDLTHLSGLPKNLRVLCTIILWWCFSDSKQEAKVKLAEAEKRRVEQEAEKQRREEEIERKKKERAAELDRRTQVGLAKPLQIRQNKITTHRGEGAFTETEFEILNEIRAREKKLVSNYSLI